MQFNVLLSSNLLAIYALGFVISWATCFSIIRLSGRFHSRSGDLSARQAMHTTRVPRIAGSAIYAALIFMFAISAWTPWTAKDFGEVIISVTPLFIVAFLEDLGVAMTPLKRILAIAASSAITIATWGVWVKSVDIPGIDAIFAIAPIAIPATIFMAAGVTNAFNLIDGLNGLAGITGVTTAIALATIAIASGHPEIASASLLMASFILGFLVFNFPWGKIFLGDAGAYLIGYILVWLAIGLTNDKPNVSPLAILLIFFWPIADTLLAIWRRLSVKKPANQPDRLHFHQLVLRYLEIRHLGRGRRHIANPLTTTLMLPMIVAPQVAGVTFANSPAWAGASVVVFGVLFVATYKVGLCQAAKIARRKAPKCEVSDKNAVAAPAQH
jgi:UDP-GlcNAc:undecaprenyl-phosphate GlcNAc-1-phosphate transferase